jgi:hypothetical protein
VLLGRSGCRPLGTATHSLLLNVPRAGRYRRASMAQTAAHGAEGEATRRTQLRLEALLRGEVYREARVPVGHLQPLQPLWNAATASSIPSSADAIASASK